MSSIREIVEDRLARIETGDPAIFTRVYRAEALGWLPADAAS